MHASKSVPAKNQIVTGLISLYHFESFGVRTLFSVLKAEGKPAKAIFLKDLQINTMTPPTSHEIDLLIDTLERTGVNLVGLSVRSPFFDIARRITLEIRKRVDALIVWGGIHATVCPEECIDVADVVCIGEGEGALLDLVRALEEGRSILKIENLWVKENGRIMKNPLRPLIQDLDSLPLPIYAGEDKLFIEDDRIATDDPLIQNARYDIMASRGCPFSCSFCTNSVLKEIYQGNNGSFIRRRSAENVMQELLMAREHLPQMRRVFFLDENFVTSKKWLADFAGRYKRQIGLSFLCEMHPKLVKKETVKTLKEAGLVDVSLGIQSCAEQIRMRDLNRPVSNQDLMKAVKILNEANVRPTYDIIVDTPFDTEEDLKEGFDFAYKIPRPYNMNLFSLVHFPKTPLTERLLFEKKISEDQVEGRSSKTLHQWRMTLDYERDKINLFYMSLIALLSKSFVPKFVIRLFSKSRWFKKNPHHLKPIVSVANMVKMFLIALRMLVRGQLNWHLVKKRSKNLSVQK